MKKNRITDTKNLQSERKKLHKRIGLAGIGFICILTIMMGIFWYINSKQTSHAQEETWVNWDLATMEQPVNHSDKILTTARATFYDIYSDSQVWDSSSGNYYSTVQPITDGVTSDAGNTFTRFNYELATSLNDKGKEYQHMYDHDKEDHVEGVYPLYCGLTWPAQFKKNDGISWGTAGFIDDSDEFMLKQRWGNLVSNKTFGWWFAAANSNQYSNDDNHKVSVLGVPGTAQGAAAQGLVNRELENGNITIGHGDYKRVLPFFDQEYLEQSYTGKIGGGTNEPITEKIRNATFYVQVKKQDFNNVAPNLYVYDDAGIKYEGEFPGALMKEYGGYYVYCSNLISSARVILKRNDDKKQQYPEDTKAQGYLLSGCNEWDWNKYNSNKNDGGFKSCSKPTLPPTAKPTTTTTPNFVSHGHVVSNIAFPFRKGEATKQSGLKIRVKKSDFPNGAPNLHLYSDVDGTVYTGAWPGKKMDEEGEYYVYTNENITSARAILSQGTWRDPLDKQPGHLISGSVEYDFKNSTFHDTTKVYFSDEEGEETDPNYYYFDSYSDVIQLDEENKRVDYFHDEKQVQDQDGINGFFPYNKAGEVEADKTNLNYVHGVKMELNFNMTGDGKIKGQPITFEFTGDDDLWVFVDGYLVLDIGGAHIPISGKIDFASKKATVDYVKPQEAYASKYRDGNYGIFDKDVVYDFGKDSGEKLYDLLTDTTKNHTLTIFYMERGKGNSNLKIKFNLPQISTMSVGNEVDASDVNKSLQTDALWKACNEHKFQYYLENKGTKEEDYDNSITDEKIPMERNVFAPIGLAAYRKKVTSEDGAAQRLRFFTFADTNYFSMVVAGTSVNLPTLRGDGAGEAEAIVGSDGCATINGQEYVFMGWTKDENYRDHWEEIQNGTYTGNCPELETDGSITVTESADFYAVWVKKNLTVSYYDEINVDTPLGYQTTNNKVVCIGHETFEMDKLLKGYIKGNSVINWWNDSDLSSGVTEANKQRTKWKTDETRKGFILNGWRLSETREDKNNEQILYNYLPLCNVKLYADWTRTHYRVQFRVKDAKQIRTETGTSDAGDGSWESDIVYFPVGAGYVGYLPYITDSSSVGDFKEIVDENTTYFDFHSLPVWNNHAIVRWIRNDEEKTSYRTTKIVENGRTLYPQEWELGKADVIFEGEWKQITSTITYEPGVCPGSNDLNWKNLKKKYNIGQTLYSPNVDELFGEEDTGDWDIVGWKQGDKTVSFPYTVTEEDVVWTAVWKKVSGTVIYHFNDAEIGITGIADYSKVSKVGSAVERLTLEGMGSSAPYDSVGSVGEDGSHTTHYIKKNGKAYVIAGWKDSDGNKVDSNTKVTEEDMEVTAIWKEVHTILNITVEVPDENKDQWDDEVAKNNGWKKEVYEGGMKWTKDVNLIPGELFSKYFDPDSGQFKEILYGAAKGESLQYNTITYPGGNFQLDDASVKVPYTADSHECSVIGGWTSRKRMVTFAYLNPRETNTANARVIGYQTYQVNDKKRRLPKSGDVLLGAGKKSSRNISKVPDLEGYELSGWTTSGFHEVLSESTGNMDNVVLYTVWTQSEANDAQKKSVKKLGTGTQTQGVSSVAQRKSKSVMQLFSFSSTNRYVPFANELYELDDLLLDGMATGRTGADGGFRLTYDQVASFMNCFSINSSMRLREMNKIYSKDGAEIADRQKMYATTWELRDIHGYITNRANNKDLKRMSVPNGEDAVIYDGRIEGERTEAFKFGNENEAQGASYATSLRALFTHKIKTSDLTITKKLTETAASVAARKGEEDQDYIFKVSFYHIFGDTTNNDKMLYTGTYVKLNKYGNYIRDDQNKIKEYTAEDGKIILKNGETAIISGIPVMTEYDIEEEDAIGKKDTYILSYAEEITAKGLANENKKYAVSDINNIESEEYLQKYEDNTYTKEMINNREKLENKKLADYDEITSEINRTVQGQIGTAGYTYNYVIENEVLIDGISLYIEKIIDEFYYDDNERFYEDVTYQELSHAKQTFIFKIKYTPVDENGSPKAGEEKLFEEVVTFDPEDGTIETVALPENMQSTDKKKGYKKTVVVLGLEPGYYEISEDEGWSWKYDLMGTFEKIHKGGILNTIYATTDRNVCKNDKNTSKKRYRCYIRGIKQSVDKDAVEVTYDGKKYRLLDNAEEPNVSFLNMKAIDERKDTFGDTDIETNKILLPTPTPNPNKYKTIRLDDAYNNKELLVGEKLVLPKVKAEKQDGTVETIITGSSEWSKLKWSVNPSSVLEVENNSLVAKGAGQTTVTVEYLDGDGLTRHTASITMKVVASHKLTLSGNNSISYQLIYSSQKLGTPPRHYPATNAVDGNKDTLWITNSESYGENVYWGLEFKDANDRFMTRKINKVSVQLEQSECNRTVEVFAITSIKGQKDFERISCGKKVLDHGDGSMLEFNVNPVGDYYGIQIVLLERSGGVAWPAIAEVEIYGD